MINLKKGISILFAAGILCAFPAEMPVSAADTEQKCGDSITWELNGDTLYLAGTGATDCGILQPITLPPVPLTAETADAWENAKWADISDQIRHIVIGDGITCVDNMAFCFLPCLESVTFPVTLEQIGALAFGGCQNLHTLVNVPETASISGEAFSFDTALMNAEKPFLIVNDCRLIAYGGTDETDISVPEQVTSIGESVFSGHTELKSVQIPESIRQIGKGAFSGCSGLTEIAIPKGVTGIEASAFADCSSLAAVHLPETITKICERAFDGCTALQVIEIPSAVQSIGDDAFQSNPWISSCGDYVVLGDGILYRFQGNQKIISLPDAVKSIKKAAISGDEIVEIQIPETVTIIEEGSIDCKYAVIAGEAGGIAEAFASEHGMPFRDVDAAAPQGTDLTIDCETDGWYFGNSGNIFGGDYYLTDADRQRLESRGLSTQGVDKDWGGSCVGLALTVILMKNGAFSPDDLQSGAQTLSDVQPTDAVCSFINYYQCTQGRDGSVTGTSDFRKIYDMSLRLPNVKHGESPFLLTFCCASGGSHGVAAYGLENGVWRYSGKEYDRRILVWDSNYPDALHDDSCLYYDSLTLDFCIPAYGVHVAEGAGDNTVGLISARNDLNVLNAYPYQFPDEISGDLNQDGSLTIADAVLLCKHLRAETGLTGRAFRQADLSGDLKVNAADLTLLKRRLLVP